MSRLYEHAAVRGLPAPIYEEAISPESTVQAPRFTAVCRYLGKTTVGDGASKRGAKQMAAERMLELL